MPAIWCAQHRFESARVCTWPGGHGAHRLEIKGVPSLGVSPPSGICGRTVQQHRGIDDGSAEPVHDDIHPE